MKKQASVSGGRSGGCSIGLAGIQHGAGGRRRRARVRSRKTHLVLGAGLIGLHFFKYQFLPLLHRVIPLVDRMIVLRRRGLKEGTVEKLRNDTFKCSFED